MTPSEDGAISLQMDGNRRLRDITIDAAHFDPPEWEMLEDLLVIAFNQITEKAEIKAAAETQKIMSNMLPGLGGLGDLFGGSESE